MSTGGTAQVSVVAGCQGDSFRTGADPDASGTGVSGSRCCGVPTTGWLAVHSGGSLTRVRGGGIGRGQQVPRGAAHWCGVENLMLGSERPWAGGTACWLMIFSKSLLSEPVSAPARLRGSRVKHRATGRASSGQPRGSSQRLAVRCGRRARFRGLLPTCPLPACLSFY